uniref:Serine protease n=1 Tax=Sotepeofons virus TaxID=3072221 RepID=A0AA96NNT9_9VIRU|nr:MAG: hypothetical protein [Sotepeofons virus]
MLKQAVVAHKWASAVLAMMVSVVLAQAPRVLESFLEQARGYAGCDPIPRVDTWEEWALVLVDRGVRLLLYRETVSQTWIQWTLGCSRTTYEYRDFRVPLGLALGLSMVYYLRTMKRWQKMRRLIDSLAVSPEGLIPGSPLLEGGRMPKGQVAVAIRKDGTLTVVGGGLRVENYLILPTHNTVYGYELWILNGEREAKVDVDGEVMLAADVVAYPVPENTWSRLGVGQVKLGPLKDMTTVTVTSSCDRKYSVATLKATAPMGRVVYEGSTQPGFSGSAYMNGTVVVGMHCHGGVRGGGYEMLYIYNRLKLQLDQPPEDSPDFFVRQAKFGYDYEELYDDNVVLRMKDGNYHRTKKETLERMKQLEHSAQWADEVEYEELREQLQYIPESMLVANTHPGEGRRPAVRAQAQSRPAELRSLPDSSLSAEKRPPQHVAVPALTQDKEVNLSKRLAILEKTISKLSKQHKKPTVHQTLAAVQNGTAS